MEEKNEKNAEKNSSHPAKSSNAALWWILGGCLALLLVGGLVIGGIAYFGYKKVKKEVKKNQPNLERLQAELEKVEQQARQSAEQAHSPISSSDENYSEEPTPVLPDNTERQMGYVKKVYAKSGKYYLNIDYIQWFTGDAAEQAMREDGECEPSGECLVLNDYYIRNVNPLIRTFEIAPDAIITMQTYDLEATGQIQNQVITTGQFAQIWSASAKPGLRDVPYIVEVANKKIVKINEQYIP